MICANLLNETIGRELYMLIDDFFKKCAVSYHLGSAA